MDSSVSESLYDYWVVVVDELLPPPPELRSFPTLGELVDFIKSVHRERKSAWVLPLFGEVLSVTEGGPDNSLRFLVDPTGLKIPLFDMQEDEAASKEFYPVGGKKYIELLAKAMAAEEEAKSKPLFREPPPRRFEFIQDDEEEGDAEFDPKAY